MNLFVQMIQDSGKDEVKHEVELLTTHIHRHEDHSFEGSEFMDDALRMNEQFLDEQD